MLGNLSGQKSKKKMIRYFIKKIKLKISTLINCKQILITEKSQQIYLIELLKRGLLSGLQIKKNYIKH